MSEPTTAERERELAFHEIEHHLHEAVVGLLEVSRILTCAAERIAVLRKAAPAAESEAEK